MVTSSIGYGPLQWGAIHQAIARNPAGENKGRSRRSAKKISRAWTIETIPSAGSTAASNEVIR